MGNYATFVPVEHVEDSKFGPWWCEAKHHSMTNGSQNNEALRVKHVISNLNTESREANAKLWCDGRQR